MTKSAPITEVRHYCILTAKPKSERRLCKHMHTFARVYNQAGARIHHTFFVAHPFTITAICGNIDLTVAAAQHFKNPVYSYIATYVRFVCVYVRAVLCCVL